MKPLFKFICSSNKEANEFAKKLHESCPNLKLNLYQHLSYTSVFLTSVNIGIAHKEDDSWEDEILHVTVAKIENKKPIKVELNPDYTAKVYSDKVVVGCETFPIDKLDELVKARDTILGTK